MLARTRAGPAGKGKIIGSVCLRDGAEQHQNQGRERVLNGAFHSHFFASQRKHAHTNCVSESNQSQPMKSKPLFQVGCFAVVISTATFLAGCASTGESSASAGNTAGTAGPVRIPTQYRADDGRVIDIGKSTPADGGFSFKDPHMEKCWIADGF